MDDWEKMHLKLRKSLIGVEVQISAMQAMKDLDPIQKVVVLRAVNTYAPSSVPSKSDPGDDRELVL